MRKEISFLLRQEGKKLREVIELAQYQVAVKCLGLMVSRVVVGESNPNTLHLIFNG